MRKRYSEGLFITEDRTLQLLSAWALAVAAAILTAAVGTVLYVLDGGPVVVASGESTPNYWVAVLLVVVLPLVIGTSVFFSIFKRESRPKEARHSWR